MRSEQTNLALPADLKARAREECVAQGVSLSTVVADLLKEWLRQGPQWRAFLRKRTTKHVRGEVSNTH